MKNDIFFAAPAVAFIAGALSLAMLLVYAVSIP
jgi:hypothetical protein